MLFGLVSASSSVEATKRTFVTKGILFTADPSSAVFSSMFRESTDR